MTDSSAIFWSGFTNDCTKLINPDDPNEPFETGFRSTYLPLLDQLPDDEKYRQMHNHNVLRWP